MGGHTFFTGRSSIHEGRMKVAELKKGITEFLANDD